MSDFFSDLSDLSISIVPNRTRLDYFEHLDTIRLASINQFLDEIIISCDRLALILDDSYKLDLCSIINIVLDIHDRIMEEKK